MKKMIKNKKGFTLAELLIVVAIIAVLVAISVPIFTGNLKKARLATNQANARAAKAAAVSAVLDADSTGSTTYYKYDSSADKGETATAASGTSASTTSISDWTTDEFGSKTYDTWYITVGDDGTVSAINYE